jgi:OOP family OmpA-OmpF porin
MYIRTLIAITSVLAAAGCSTSSGPMHNTDLVTLANGTKAYRVQCLGLLESSQSCLDEVKPVCGDKTATPVSLIDRASSGLKPDNDPREITFTCATSVAQQAPAPVAPPPAPQPLAASVPARKFTLQDDANFAVNSAALTPAASTKLDAFIDAHHNVEIQRLTIAGYTDSTGSEVLNNQLSAARARAVLSYLTAHGMRAAQYDANGLGSASPVASNATAAGRAKNRRVEIQTVGKSSDMPH